MAADEVWEMVTCHLLLWGNAFLYKSRDSLQVVRELWPLDPSRVQVRRTAQLERRFLIDGKLDYGEAEILHIRGASVDGLVGLSPVQEAREALGVIQAQGNFQGKFLRDEGRPGVLLHHPNKVSSEAADRLERSFSAVNSGGTKLLEEGITAEKWTMPLEDAQFLQSMQYSDLRVAQLFGIPPRRLGAKSGDSLTYATTESEGRDYVTYTLRRWMGRIEHSIRRDPSIFTQGDRFFCEFLADALMRGDTKARYEAHKIGLEANFLTVEEVRRFENLPEADAPSEPAAGE
jgi:HK97 family phage portal protein